MAALSAVTWAAYWILLPVILITSVIFRFNLLSCIYLLFLLALPFTPQHSLLNFVSWANFSLCLACMSGLFILGHIGFQIALLANSPYGSLVGDDCSIAESITRYIGFVRFNHVDVGNVFRILLPDVAVFLAATLTYILVKRVKNNAVGYLSLEKNGTKRSSRTKLKHDCVFFVTMVFMALAGIAYPSIISSIYLLVFISLGTVWTFLKSLVHRSTVILRAILSAVTFLQLLLLYVYQLQFMQTYIPPEALYSRLLGLTAIIQTDCSVTYKLLLNPTNRWPEYVSPVCVFLLHWILAAGVQMYRTDYQALRGKVGPLPAAGTSQSIFQTRKSGEKKPLVDAEDLPQNYDAVASTSSVHLKEEQEEPASSNVQEEEVPIPSGFQSSRMSTSSEKTGVLINISLWFSHVKRYSFYIIALIVMMLWSVTYHSWLTFVLLLMACILWMTKRRAVFTLYCSPFLVFYGICLVLLQFIYSLNLKEELPTVINRTNGVLILSDFGIVRYQNPCLHLGAQLLYLCGFWIVLHQFNYRRLIDRGGVQGSPSGISLTWTEETANFIHEQMCKYWIFVVIAVHLAVATEGSPTAIKVTYMFFFLLNMSTYCISWQFWRRTLTFYWTILVGYTMLVLILIYTFQFQQFPEYYKQLTNFTDQELADLGLTQAANAGSLLAMVVIPTVFLLFVIFQLHYFNQRFLELTQPPAVTATAGARSSKYHSGIAADDDASLARDMEIEMNDLSDKDSSWFSRKFAKWKPTILELWNKLTSLVMLAFEFHTWRLVFLTVFVAAVYQVSAVYAVYVFFWVLLLPFRGTHVPLFVITSFLTAVIILSIMIYQLQFIEIDTNLEYNCTMYSYDNNYSFDYNLPEWLVVGKMSEGEAFFYHAQGYISIIIMIAFERTIMRRQHWLRRLRNERPPVATALFPHITHKQVDESLKHCCMFMLNYFFIKFGVEACFIMSVLTVWARTDIFSIVYCICLIMALFLRKRSSLYRFWGFYVGFLMLLILWQYLALLGMPPVWCQYHNYPWLVIGTNETIRNRLVNWLHLPDYIVTLEVYPSVADFFQLLFVVSQLFVFRVEEKLQEFVGDNTYLTGNELNSVTSKTNPKKNFLTKRSRSMLDQFKQFVFVYFIWITMAIIFFAGTSRISVFTLGYLIIFFYLLARQQALLMGKPSHLLKVFTRFIGFTVGVITLKACLQVASCVYVETLHEHACVGVELMSLVCAKPNVYNISAQLDDNCQLLYDSAGFSWDFICFVFLLMQRRIFASYYFMHVAEDMRIAFSQAARGAELFNEKLVLAVKEREKLQELNLLSIKDSMNAIKKSYHSIRKTSQSQISHMDATRAGDYYMFDDEIYVRKPARVKMVAPEEEEAEESIMHPVKMLYKAETVGISETLEERQEDKKKIQVMKPEHRRSKMKSFGETSSPEDESEEKKQAKLSPVDSTNSALLGKGPRASQVKFKATVTEQTIEEDQPTSMSNVRHDAKLNDETAEEENEPESSFSDKVKRGMEFAWELFLSGIDSFILFLNKHNKTFRNIVMQLSVEKENLNQRHCISARHHTSVGVFSRAHQSVIVNMMNDEEEEEDESIKEPSTLEETEEHLTPQEAEEHPIQEETEVHLPQKETEEHAIQEETEVQLAQTEERLAQTEEPPIQDVKDQLSLEGTEDRLSQKETEDDLALEQEESDSESSSSQSHIFQESRAIDFDKDQPRTLRLFYAVWYALISRTDLVCYFLIILNLMLKASIMALVLPLAVFLWATFVIPRPAKYFWTFAIVYVEIIVVVKFIFQFEFWSWNSSSEENIHIDDPFWWPRLVGVIQSPTWSIMELLQLLAIFFHLSLLKVHGLWDRAEIKHKESADNNLDIDASVSQTSVSEATQFTPQPSKKKFTRKFSTILKLPYYLYRTLLNQRFTSVTDVYLWMFLCDVINFLIIIFGYSAFGKFPTGGSVVTNLQENNVPTAFLVMLLIQFIMMFIDRAIYLNKSLVAKFIFQIVLVIGIHAWMFFILPSLNQRPFYENHIAQTYYFFKAVYFLLAAYQLRAGYPKRVTGNFLTKSYSTVNLFLFKGYQAIPFLAEITAIMDWMYTGTSMTIGEWMKVWAIHAEVFEIKCWRVFENDYPVPRGEAKAKLIKFLQGGFLLFILLAIIWFPLLLMNIALTIGGIANNPIQVDVKITLGTFEPIFQVVADYDDITVWNKHRFDEFSQHRSSNEFEPPDYIIFDSIKEILLKIDLLKKFELLKAAAAFLRDFSEQQVVTITIDGESKTVWIISPPQRQLLLNRLRSNNTRPLTVLIEWTLTNDPAKTSVVTSTGSHAVSLAANSTARKQLFALLSEESNDEDVVIANLFPQYIHSQSEKSSSPPAFLLYPNKEDDFTDIGVNIQSLPNQTTTTSWWRITTSGAEKAPGSPNIKMTVFSDKVSPTSLSFLVNYGIIGLYVSVVLVVGRLVRTVFIGTTATFMFSELPHVDRILNLCNDIFLVREEAEYVLEEDLYAKLLFLYRSPATLIKWTKKPKVD